MCIEHTLFLDLFKVETLSNPPSLFLFSVNNSNYNV